MNRKCSHCGVTILDDTEYCPLCHHVLKKDDEDGKSPEVLNLYPDISMEVRKIVIARRILLYIAIAVGLICIFINYRTYHGLLWSAIVISGLFYIFVIFLLSSNERLGAFGKVGWISFFGFLYTISIDIVLGYTKWSITYVLPSWLVFLNIVLVIFMIIDHTRFQSYILQEFYFVVMSIVLFILVREGVLQSVELAEIALMISILIFLGILILGGRAAHTELIRRFHL